MQVPLLDSETAIRFDEPVKLLLARDNRDPASWSISPEATVFEAIERMAENQSSALVVLSAQKLDGILSERDYARRAIVDGRPSRETRIYEIMTKSVYYVNPETSIEECMRLMTSRNIRHLPVLDGSTVIGLLSMNDLVAWAMNTLRTSSTSVIESYAPNRRGSLDRSLPARDSIASGLPNPMHVREPHLP